MSSYAPIQNHENDAGVFKIDDDEVEEDSSYPDEPFMVPADRVSSPPHSRIQQPLEVSSGADGDIDTTEGYSSTVSLFSWSNPWFPNILVGCLFVLPVTLVWMLLLTQLIGQWWLITPFMAHACMDVTLFYALVRGEFSLRHSCWQLVTTLHFWLEVSLLGAVYPLVVHGIIDALWLEADGSITIEYQNEARALLWMTYVCYVAVVFKICIGTLALFTCCSSDGAKCPRRLATVWACLDRHRQAWSPSRKGILKTWIQMILAALSVVAWAGLGACLISVFIHFGNFEAPPPHFYDDCDPLDETECWLPFPSYRHMIKDASTKKGWRVNLHPRRLPPLKGGARINPSFLNELDGFSTMAPMLFYLDGLKEAIEAMEHKKGSGLFGAAMMSQSTTPNSITLLMDVATRSLVAHSAEIDYLDPEHPLVLMFPAKPLYHDRHYAVVVCNAVDQNARRIPQSTALAKLLFGNANETSHDDTLDPDRAERYRRILIPALHEAVPWLDLEKDPGALQLLYDFHTVSSSSQLGAVRSVRDGTLSILDHEDWDWANHVHVTKRQDFDCQEEGQLLARILYADMKIPWFLQAAGPGQRTARLDKRAVSTGRPLIEGTVKFAVHIPCSIRNSIINGSWDSDTAGNAVQAVVEYGHGLFYGLEEASETYLQQLAQNNRYIITAMDWRGMSASDLLVVAKTLLSDPSLFEAVRDNLIQGYAAKFALQHFTKHALFGMDWLDFEESTAHMPSVPVADGSSIPRVFYGNSQGGILGAGYSSLARPDLIDRSVLGVPGTPFALIMSRSADFVGYDMLMLLSLYNNRHVRMLLSLVQMAWDSVEGSGVLAPPLEEPFPPTLLQAGLGDPVVTTQAAEGLARAYHAMLIPSNPRGDVYAIPLATTGELGMTINSEDGTAPVFLTELLFKQEYSSLPTRDVLPPVNWVHICTRLDDAMIRQLTDFIQGQVTDVCENDGCIRDRADCF